MRKNQVSIQITRFGDQVPKGYPEDKHIISIYADSNNLYAALSEAYAKTINVVEEWEAVAARCDISTNADGSVLSRALNRRCCENIDLEYTEKLLKMDKRLLGYIENADEIIKVIKSSTKDNVRDRLEELLRYSAEEVQIILRIYFGMMTAEDTQRLRDEILELEETLSRIQS